MSDDSTTNSRTVEVVAARDRLVAIGMAAVFFACVLFTVVRGYVQLTTGRATPWWGNAAGAVVIGILYFWYRRSPEERSGLAVHGTAVAATIALWVPVCYRMPSSKWWLSLVGFAVLLMGRRREAIVWGTLTAILIPVTAAVEPFMAVPNAIGEPLAERVAAGLVFVLVLFGITLAFRRAAEERALQLAETAESLERANRVRNRFLAHMSHEIRTPLHGVIAMTDLALRDKLPRSARQQLEGAYESAEVLLTLLNNLLDVTRVEADAVEIQAKPFNLHRALGECLRPLSARAEAKGLAFEARAAPGIACARVGDKIRLIQVVLNLVGNAVKFTDTGGVSVAVRESEDGARVVMTVDDTGRGIAPEDREKVFLPFTQIIHGDSRFERGAGVGLAIAQAIAGMMDGSIELDDAPGGGARFTVDLALPREPSSNAQGSNAQGPVNLLLVERDAERRVVISSRRRRVLVCEDEPMNRRAVKRMLALLGHDVVAVGDGLEAWERLQEEPFDVVLTDVEMPRLDGVALIGRIRAREGRGEVSRVPIVACTAHVGQGEQHRLLDAGADAHLAKPFTAEGLAAVLEAAMVTSRAPASDPLSPAPCADGPRSTSAPPAAG
jgi:signal transduction histidine kinase/ActR/RegA family two-component response regulator